MKREITIALLLALFLTGCGRTEDPYRVDTVVRIPVDPTDAPTEIVTEPTEKTETQPEEETQAPTETAPETTEASKKQSSGTAKNSGGSKTSGSKSSSGKNSGTTSSKNNANKATEPPQATQPPKTTEPPMSAEPAETTPPTTDPPATETATEEVPVTEPAGTEPTSTESSTTGPASTEPSATESPVTEPPETEPELYDISGYAVGTLENSMLDQINGARAEAGLNNLSLNSYLSAIASCRGYEISQVWSHTRPDGRGYYTVLSDYGYGAGAVTELLVYVSGTGDAASIVDKWLSSDSHKESLLSDSYTTAGIGIYRANGFTYVCCLLVG